MKSLSSKPCITVASLLGLMVLSACQIGPRSTSPDIVYSKDAETARKLQVPPDLSAVSPEEQFVLPGDSGGVISRNTLLPAVRQGQYVREGDRDWLALSATPEALWPNLLAFVSEEGFTVDSTQPLAGTITTEWRKAGGESGTLARSAEKTENIRLSLRLERANGEGGVRSRLLARLQTASANRSGEATLWSAAAAHPEKSSIVLKRFLAFVGIKNQQAQRLIDQDVAANLLQASEIARSEGTTSLVVHHGLNSSYKAVGNAIRRLGLDIDESTSTPTIMNVADKNGKFAPEGGAERFVVLLRAEHVSKVNVDLVTPEGGKLQPALKSVILRSIQQVIAKTGAA